MGHVLGQEGCWDCDFDCSLKYFLFKNIFFIFKKLFLILEH